MKTSTIKKVLPLLDTIKNIRPKQRVVLFSHMDDETRDMIYQSLTHLLTSQKVPVKTRLMLKKKLNPFRKSFQLLMDKKKSPKFKQKVLLQMGGAPSMSYALRQAIPALLDMFKK